MKKPEKNPTPPTTPQHRNADYDGSDDAAQAGLAQPCQSFDLLLAQYRAKVYEQNALFFVDTGCSN